jgi:hypothetical protein
VGGFKELNCFLLCGVKYWTLKTLANNDSFKYFFAVILGAILSLGVYLLIEWFKNERAHRSWLISLIIEVSQNYEQKKREIGEFMVHFSGMPKGMNIFEIYKNSFDIFYAFLKSGYSLKNKEILFKYAEYINNETRHFQFRVNWFINCVDPNILRDGLLVSTSADFPHFDLIYEKDKEQFELIKIVKELLEKETKIKYKEKVNEKKD